MLFSVSRNLFLHRLRKRFPELTEEEIKKIYLERLDKCHNRNYYEGLPGRLTALGFN